MFVQTGHQAVLCTDCGAETSFKWKHQNRGGGEEKEEEEESSLFRRGSEKQKERDHQGKNIMLISRLLPVVVHLLPHLIDQV